VKQPIGMVDFPKSGAKRLKRNFEALSNGRETRQTDGKIYQECA
jgi:hypothetical protein